MRYHWHIGRGELLAMDLRTTLSIGQGGVSAPRTVLPSVRIAIAIDPETVSPEGQLQYAWRVLSARVLDDSDAATAPILGGAFPIADGATSGPTETLGLPQPSAAMVADGLRREVSAIASLVGRGTLDARGLASDITVSGEADLAAADSPEMIEQIRQTLRDLASPFPEQSVGIGARWSKTSEIDARDVRLVQRETLTLAQIHGNVGTVNDDLTQSAPEHTEGEPAGDGGGPRMLAEGHSRIRFDLERIVPTTEFDGTTTIVDARATSGRTHELTMSLRVGIDIAGSIR
jgi:hypothetical protein